MNATPYQRRKQQGLCMRCSQHALSGHTECKTYITQPTARRRARQRIRLGARQQARERKVYGARCSAARP